MDDPLNKYGTSFLETEALLAAQEDDSEYLSLVLAKLNLHELRRLQYAAQRLTDECVWAEYARPRESSHGN